MSQIDLENSQLMFGLTSWLQKGLAAVCLALLMPFSILNLINGSYVVGFGVLAVVVLFALVIVRQGKKGFFNPNLFLMLLVPVVIGFIGLATFRDGIQAYLWSYPTILMYYFLLPQRAAWLANGMLIVVMIPLAFIILELPLAFRAVVTLILVSLLPALSIHVIQRLQDQLSAMATHDSLTGLLNRTLLADKLNSAIDRRRSDRTPMTLVAFDLDHFKQINDQHGHAAGDKVLCDFANVLKARSRKTDTVFRLGGEEFLLLLDDVNAEDAHTVAADICERLESLESGENIVVRTSAGLAALREEDNYASWMKRADRCLYEAKAKGRNQIVADSIA